MLTNEAKASQTFDPMPSVAQYQHKASNAAGLFFTYKTYSCEHQVYIKEHIPRTQNSKLQ